MAMRLSLSQFKLVIVVLDKEIILNISSDLSYEIILRNYKLLSRIIFQKLCTREILMYSDFFFLTLDLFCFICSLNKVYQLEIKNKYTYQYFLLAFSFKYLDSARRQMWHMPHTYVKMCIMCNTLKILELFFKVIFDSPNYRNRPMAELSKATTEF